MAKIFSKVGKSVVDNIPVDAYDTTFDQTSVVDLYNSNLYNSVSSVNSNKGLLDVYYKKYGYLSLIGDIGSYLIGTKDATSLLQSGLSTIIPGVTKSGIGTFALHTINLSLRTPFISNLINNAVPSPFAIRPEGVIKWQYLPSQMLLASNPPTDYATSDNSGDLLTGIISNAAAGLLATTISGLSKSGTLTGYDWDRAVNTAFDTADIITLSATGLKYTKAVGWYDVTRPTWSDRPGFITYDRYIAYADGELNYPKVSSNYKDTMLDRFDPQANTAKSLASLAKEPLSQLVNAPIPSNTIPTVTSDISKGILSNGLDTTKAYKAAMGQTIDPDKDPDKKYTNQPGIREKMDRLGFPLYNKSESINLGIKGGWNDAINIQDIIEDNSYNYENAQQRDIIDFKFEDISSIGRNNPVILLFRAAIMGLTDDWTPSWTDTKYLGRPDTFYTYEGYTRKIGFDMKVYCNSRNEVVPQWRKLNRLAGMCYPVSYANNRAMKAPIIRLTIGNLYRRIYGFLDSFGLTIDDDTLWDTDLGYQLPMIITAKIGFTVMYESDGQGAPISNMPHFNQDRTFPQQDGTGESIYGNRYPDKTKDTLPDATPRPSTIIPR